MSQSTLVSQSNSGGSTCGSDANFDDATGYAAGGMEFFSQWGLGQQRYTLDLHKMKG